MGDEDYCMICCCDFDRHSIIVKYPSGLHPTLDPTDWMGGQRVHGSCVEQWVKSRDQLAAKAKARAAAEQEALARYRQSLDRLEFAIAGLADAIGGTGV